jgi:hypothetical protein
VFGDECVFRREEYLELAAIRLFFSRMTAEEIQIWRHYEDIAMHFNTLLMQYRLQFMGGAGAIGAVASYLIGGKVDNLSQRHWLRFLVSAGVFLLVLAAALLDAFYYNELLRGAVKELLAFEEAHPEIQLSTSIENTVGWGKHVIYVVYVLLLGSLGWFVHWSWKNRKDGTDTTGQ